MSTITFEEFVKMVDDSDKVEVFLSWGDLPLPACITERKKNSIEMDCEIDDPIIISNTDSFTFERDGDVKVKTPDDEYSFSFFTRKKRT